MSAGVTSAAQTPVKTKTPVPETNKERSALISDPSSKATQMTNMLRLNPLGVNHKARQLFQSIQSNPADFKNTAVLVFDISKYSFEIDPEHEDILKSIIIVNSPEALTDLLCHLLRVAHDPAKVPESSSSTGSSSSPSATSSASSSPPSSAPLSYSAVLKTAKKIESQPLPVTRPEDHRKSLATLNCGEGTASFQCFKRKHLIQKPFDPDTCCTTGFWTAVHNRINDPFSLFTFFFTSDGNIEYEYEDRYDVCKAVNPLPSVTCRRHKLDDNISICTFSGECYPDYLRQNGHLASPLDCQKMPNVDPADFSVSLERMKTVQDMFAARYINQPPLEHDWMMAKFRKRKFDALARGQTFTEEPPEKILTPREQILADYQDALRQFQIPEIPREVYELFFRQPTAYFRGVKPSAGAPRDRAGMVAIGDIFIAVNPDAVAPNLEAIPPAPGHENFPSLPSGTEPGPNPDENLLEGEMDTREEDNAATSNAARNAAHMILRRRYQEGHY